MLNIAIFYQEVSKIQEEIFRLCRKLNSFNARSAKPWINSDKGVIQSFHCLLTDSGVQRISKERRYPEGHFRFPFLNYFCSAMSRRRSVPDRIHKNQSQTYISGENQHGQRQQHEANDAQFRPVTQIPKRQHDACHSRW